MPLSARLNPWLVACVIWALALVALVCAVGIVLMELQGKQTSSVLAMLAASAVSSLGSLLGDPLHHGEHGPFQERSNASTS